MSFLPWYQSYDPLGSQVLSTVTALLPMAILIGLLLLTKMRPYVSAYLALLAAALVAGLAYQMPPEKILASMGYGLLYGLLPIGWIVLNVFFFFKVLTDAGTIDGLKNTLVKITDDQRLQLLLVAFCFGAILEGAAGFGTPVAITASILIGLGFSPLQSSFLSLLANTAPVAYGGLGTPIIALQGVTGLPLSELSGMVAKLLTPIGVIIPVWLVWAFSGWRKTREILPVLLLSGISFSTIQWATATFHGPWLAGIAAGMGSLAVTVMAIKVKSRGIKNFKGQRKNKEQSQKKSTVRIWFPWVILVLFMLLWGLPMVKGMLDFSTISFHIPGLDQEIFRIPPIVEEPQAEPAVFRLNWLSATGTAIFFATVTNGLALGYKPRDLFRFFFHSVIDVRFSLLTISGMMSLGFITRFSGMDGTLGLAFASAGSLYPFFGTLLGWLGVAITGSDTSSNVLFGSLQTITARQLGFAPVVMAAANSAGGVMGKMIDAQSIVIASTATRWFGHEREILRRIVLHSITLAVMVALIVTGEIYLR